MWVAIIYKQLIIQCPRTYCSNLLKVWKDVLDAIPEPAFTRDAVYRVWHDMTKKQWMLDNDPLGSARLLLEHAKVDAGLSPRSHAVQTIDLGENRSYDSVAFSIPRILEEWGGRIREVIIDSACK